MTRNIPTQDGYWVNEAFHHLAEIIQDYDPNFELVWIPPDKRTAPIEHERPFAIVDRHPGYAPYVVTYMAETDDPSKILAYLFEFDTRRHSPEAILNKMELGNKAAELLKKKAQMEVEEEQKDKIAFMARTRLNFVKMDGKKYDSEFRRIE